MEIEEGEATHVVDIPRVNDGLLAKMEDRISKIHPSTGTNETRTTDKRCIFRLPTRLNNINGKLLEPQVVALGPYHHGKPQLQNMEEFKWRCLAKFMKSRKGKLEECLIELGLLEKEVRECYSESETINLSRDELLQMMVVDGFFILALFFTNILNIADRPGEDELPPVYPIKSLDRVILAKVEGDLLLLENQIPSCVLKTLYRICIKSRKSLFVVATNFLRFISVIPYSKNMPDSLQWFHLLDLVRSIFVFHCHYKEIRIPLPYNTFSPITCVTKLRRAGIKVNRAGIKVNRHMVNSFLNVKFKNGEIKMPAIILNDSFCSLLVNCVAFEQSCNVSKYFSIYATFLDCLVNTAIDVDYLCDRRVIDNFFGTGADAAQFINNLGKDLTIYENVANHGYFLFFIFENINKYYHKWLDSQWTSFKREYFGKPWLLISAFVGFVLLVLTFLQTYYTIYAYVHPKN